MLPTIYTGINFLSVFKQLFKTEANIIIKSLSCNGLDLVGMRTLGLMIYLEFSIHNGHGSQFRSAFQSKEMTLYGAQISGY